MTLPTPSTPPASSPPPIPAAAPAPVRFPLGWLLQHAAPPIKYRSVTDVARLEGADAARLRALPLSYRPALALAMAQGPDGVWNRSMLGVPATTGSLQGVGTINAVRRLLEYGWERDTPPIHISMRRVLYRLLAEDEDPAWLFELGADGEGDEDWVRRGRAILREAAASALAQAGCEGDPRLRGAAQRIVARIGEFIRSPLAGKPFVRVGNQHVLANEAAPPSIYALTMLAHMPLFRTEHYDTMERLYHYLSQPLPRTEPVQLCGKQVIPQPHLVLGDLLGNRNVADADVPSALMWLETMARLGYLRRNEGWLKLYERMLDDCDAQGIWHPHKGMETAETPSVFAWPMYPLEERQDGDARWTDVTFRLGLVARLLGRPIEVV